MSQMLAMLAPRIRALASGAISMDGTEPPIVVGRAARPVATGRVLHQMTFLRALPSGATRPAAVHFPAFG